MPLLIQADLDRKMRIWFYRLIALTLTPAHKSVLSQYVSSIDRILRVDDDCLKEGIRLAAQYDECTEAEIRAALCVIVDAPPAKRDMATKALHVLEALVARIKYGSAYSDRVRIDKAALKVLGFLNEWFCSQPSSGRQEQPGGAPAIIAQVLTQLEGEALRNRGEPGEPGVALWTIYHSEKQAKLFDEQVKFLKIAEDCAFSPVPIRQAGRADHPVLCNYPMEFAKGSQFALTRPDGSICTFSAGRSDRVIAIAQESRFYDASGAVTPGEAPPSVPLHLLAADPWRGPACMAQVAHDYRYWIIGGLHNVNDPVARASLDSDLQQIPPVVTVHVEIAGPKISPWFQDVLGKFVNSIGVNVDDLPGLVQTVAANRPDLEPPPPAPDAADLALEHLLRLALWLACALDQERVYIHGLVVDYVVRRAASSDDLNREVAADLLAKQTVVNRARGVGVAARPAPAYGLPDSNLVAFIDVCAQRAFPVSSWATLAGLPAMEVVLDSGWFDDVFTWRERSVPFRVAVVPVGLFRIEPAHLLFVGAGDTSSAVSFVYGCFTTAGIKRQ